MIVKNWRKIRDDKWENVITHRIVEIYKVGGAGRGWVVILSHHENVIGKIYKSRKYVIALDRAIRFMRRHPRGR